jgi:hypothetical protein
MRTVVAIVVLVCALAGCVTPSIPIPPPDPQQMMFELDVDAGQGTFEYPPNSNYGDAIVYIYNRTVGEGIIATARADGSVGPTGPFPARLDDEIAVTFESDAQVAGTCVVLTSSGPRPQCN